MNTTVLYAGTFDPMTNGHSDIVRRARKVFDKVIVAIAANPAKQPLFNLDERVRLANTVLAGEAGVTVIGFNNLLIDCVRQQGAHVVLRGLRAASDFEFEFQLAGMNRRLDANIETVFMTPSEGEMFVSASLVKEIALLGGDVAQFVHPAVVAALKTRIL